MKIKTFTVVFFTFTEMIYFHRHVRRLHFVFFSFFETFANDILSHFKILTVQTFSHTHTDVSSLLLILRSICYAKRPGWLPWQSRQSTTGTPPDPPASPADPPAIQTLASCDILSYFHKYLPGHFIVLLHN